LKGESEEDTFWEEEGLESASSPGKAGEELENPSPPLDGGHPIQVHFRLSSSLNHDCYIGHALLLWQESLQELIAAKRRDI
jgi:hypothetical protein